MIFLSSNHFSVDIQTADAVSYLDLSDNLEHQSMAVRFAVEFPEWSALQWSGSWVDAEASDVDVEYMDWVRDWLERNTPVIWNDGEPVIYEEGDEIEEL